MVIGDTLHTALRKVQPMGPMSCGQRAGLLTLAWPTGLPQTQLGRIYTSHKYLPIILKLKQFLPHRVAIGITQSMK